MYSEGFIMKSFLIDLYTFYYIIIIKTTILLIEVKYLINNWQLVHEKLQHCFEI